MRAVAACSYLGLLLLPALYAAREDDYIAFHANQGLTLLLAEAVYALLLLAAGRVGLLLLPWGYYRRWTLLLHWAALAPLPFCLLGAFRAMRGTPCGRFFLSKGALRADDPSRPLIFGRQGFFKGQPRKRKSAKAFPFLRRLDVIK